MHVAVERAEAVVIICLPCAHNDAVAAGNVVRLDPPSQGVGLERSQPLSLDVGLTDITAHFGGAEEVRRPPSSPFVAPRISRPFGRISQLAGG
jgi:hypothetical protein